MAVRGGRRRGSPLGCGRLCDHAATISSSTVPQIQFIDSGWPFLLWAETGTHSANCAADRRDSSGAALGPVLDMPVVQRGAQFACRGRRHLRRGADADSYGPSFRKNLEFLQLQYIDKVIDVGFAGPAVPRCCRGGGSRELPQLRR